MMALFLIPVACAGGAGHDTTLAAVPPVAPGQEEAFVEGIVRTLMPSLSPSTE